ncbi:dolichyl-phosphate beta-glucosyltransferase [Histoplasma capsulatum G186AR]|uniref:dolichyl-phosphate beta-glucosyltransferase n=2 Tax=Ajellomyces capsulatus TaxID=5037 RepID=C0NR72_AJECG|nr:dolichyl-phosphate beta-glucosyltransferase [Histoplasma capsulatum G186AR]EEH06186.1 dolichyl-phosphate beta-glucosyltransferase [Histoplasma capsulatum G186AR]
MASPSPALWKTRLRSSGMLTEAIGEIHPSSDLVADGCLNEGATVYSSLVSWSITMVDLKALSAICSQCVELASRTPPSLWIISLLSTFAGFILFKWRRRSCLCPWWFPAFNEEDRLGGMLEEAVNYLERTYGKLAECQQDGTLLNEVTKCERTRRRKLDGGANGSANRSADMPLRGWEILVVSDGSTDGTVETALAFAKDHQLSPHPKSHPGPWSTVVDADGVHTPPGTIRVITLTKNRGKGGAVTHGMRHVRGQYVIFADADGASRFDDLGKLVSACQRIEDVQSRGLAVGSRAHLVGSEAVVKRSKLRNFLMHSFHLILRILTPPATASIKDTQCGFKLFSRASLPYIIPYMHFEGWIFDVEMLMLAEFAGIPVAEVPVGWREVKGSKLNVVWDSLGMAWGLAILRMAWGFGVYRRT